MAGEKQEAPWPVPKFYFKVIFEGVGEMACQEVSGLNTESDTIEYRAGNSPDFSSIKMPGLRKSSDVTLRKGMFNNDVALFEYFSEIKMNTIARTTVTIQLLDEGNNPVFTWTLKNAFPLKITGTDLNVRDSEVAIEEIVLVHEGLTMTKA